jgi:geranylgeranyl pyrophosphate synthase
MLNQISPSEKRKIIAAIKNAQDQPAGVEKIIDSVVKSGGIEYAHEAMINYRSKALDLLTPNQDHTLYKPLCALVDFIINREK